MNQKSSGFDPENFLTLAESLIEINESKILEASYRTTINRSYLAVALKAASRLEPIVGAPPRSLEFYKFIEDALASRTALKSKDKLGTLRKWRNNADYDLDKCVKRSSAEFAISTAKHVLTLLESEIV